jgi:hypothetical protein
LPDYSPIIKKLEVASEDYASRYLFNGKNPAGAIFYLKNRHGWQDKTEVEYSGTIQLAAPDPAAMLKAVERLQLAQSRASETVIDVDSDPVL